MPETTPIEEPGDFVEEPDDLQLALRAIDSGYAEDWERVASVLAGRVRGLTADLGVAERTMDRVTVELAQGHATPGQSLADKVRWCVGQHSIMERTLRDALDAKQAELIRIEKVFQGTPEVRGDTVADKVQSFILRVKASDARHAKRVEHLERLLNDSEQQAVELRDKLQAVARVMPIDLTRQFGSLADKVRTLLGERDAEIARLKNNDAAMRETLNKVTRAVGGPLVGEPIWVAVGHLRDAADKRLETVRDLRLQLAEVRKSSAEREIEPSDSDLERLYAVLDQQEQSAYDACAGYDFKPPMRDRRVYRAAIDAAKEAIALFKWGETDA